MYRYLTNEELVCFQNGKAKQLGVFPSVENLESSKKYKPDVKYLHFFKNIKDLPRVQEFEKDSGGGYIGVFDLPLRIAISGKGVGKYFEQSRIGNVQPIKEVAIETKFLRTSNLMCYVFDKNCNLPADEVIKQIEETMQMLGS